MPPRQLLLLVRSMRAYKFRHPGWKLVEVKSSTGEVVEIVI